MSGSVGRAITAVCLGSAIMACVALCFEDRAQFINGCLACSIYIFCRGASVPRYGRSDGAHARFVCRLLRVAAILFMLTSLMLTSSLVVLPIAADGVVRFWAIPAMVLGCALRITSNAFDSDASPGSTPRTR